MAAKVDELQKQIAQLEEKILTIEQSENASQKELTDLEAKRRGLVTAARLDKNEKAKAALSTLDSDIFKARRAVEDDATVKASLLEQLEGAKDSLAIAQWEADRERVRGLVAALANKDKMRRIKELVGELLNLLKQLDKQEREASNAIREFEPRRMAGVSVNSAKSRFQRICADLNFGGWEFYHWKGVPDPERGYSSPEPERLLEVIDQLEP
jgi:chromosome segregation ATPase